MEFVIAWIFASVVFCVLWRRIADLWYCSRERKARIALIEACSRWEEKHPEFEL